MPEPTKIPRPFADSGDKNSIPDSSGSIGFASWQEGFPAITSEPFASGGVAPKRADFNGIFNALSLAIVWQQQGGFYAYDATTDYEVGNVAEYNGDLYKCIVANGPSSAVKAPTDTAVWSKVMTSADTAAEYLPLAGGTMTGTITFTPANSTYLIRRVDNDGMLVIVGGGSGSSTAGAKLYLYGSGNSTHPGEFGLQAGDSGGYKQLYGAPDGTLTWDGVDIATISTGTWTPVLKGGTTAGTFTYDANTAGYYVKVGKLVFFFARIATTDYGTYPTGRVRVSGLPYTSANHATSYSYINAIGYSGGVNDSVLKVSGGFIPNNSAYIDLTGQSSDAAWKKGYLSWSNSASTSYNVQLSSSYKSTNLYVTGCYESAT